VKAAKKADWRVRAYPIQVRIYSDGKWRLYSRHRDWSETAQRAYVEAQNAYPTCRVELVDSRDEGGTSKIFEKRSAKK
jgi:hypothetical protein